MAEFLKSEAIARWDQMSRSSSSSSVFSVDPLQISVFVEIHHIFLQQIRVKRFQIIIAPWFAHFVDDFVPSQRNKMSSNSMSLKNLNTYPLQGRIFPVLRASVRKSISLPLTSNRWMQPRNAVRNFPPVEPSTSLDSCALPTDNKSLPQSNLLRCS